MTQETSPFARDCAGYIERGLSVIPIAPCQKFPGTYDGHKWRPSTGWTEFSRRLMSPEEVEAAEKSPDAGIGLCLGKLSGVIAVDRDYDAGVGHILDKIIPPSPVKKIGAKGYTAFFRCNGEVTRKWSIGGECVLELHSDGKQTVLPPSIHPSTGEPYYWATEESLDSIDPEELPPLPDGWCDQVDAALAPYTATGTASSGSGLGGEIAPESLPKSDIDEICRALQMIPADDRDLWIRIGMALKGIGDDPGFNIWHNWSSTSDKFDEAAERGLRIKWRGFKVMANGVSYRTIFSEAIKYGYTPLVPDTPRQVIKPGPVGNMAIAAMEHAIRTGVIPDPEATPEEQAAIRAKKVKTGLRALSYRDLGDMVQPDWLIKDIQIMNSLAMTYGPSGSGKSFYDLDKLLHVSSGKKWNGRAVKHGAVLYVVGEGKTGVLKRVSAWCKYHKVDPGELKFWVTSQAVPFLDPAAVQELAAVIHGLPEKLVYMVVDTVNRNFGDGDENSTRDMSQFIDALDGLKVTTGACVEVVHHTGKGEAQTARGSSALRAALDTEIAVKPIDGGIRVTCTKQKDAEPFESMEFGLKELELTVVDGEPVTSLVCVPDAQAAKNAQNKSAMLDNAASDLSAGKLTLLQKLRSISNTRKHNRPDLERIIIDRSELHDELSPSIKSKSSRNNQIAWALEVGALTANGAVFDVDEAVLEKLLHE